MGEPTRRPETVELPNEIFLKEVRTLIAEGHDVTLRVRGVSMRPFLEDRRDKVVLTRPDAPKVGDAVLAEIAPAVIEKQKMMEFACTYDNIPLHTDEEYAKLLEQREAEKRAALKELEA